MSKQKAVAGGYDASSDGPEPDFPFGSDPPTKRSKSASYAPLRLSTAPKSTFQLPRSGPPSARSSVPPGPAISSSHPKMPLAAALPAVRVTPDSQNDWQMLDSIPSDSEPDGLTSRKASVDTGTNSKSGAYMPKVTTNSMSVATKSNHARSTISVERQLNELRDSFDNYVTSNDEHHKRTHEALTRVLEVAGRWAPAENMTVAPVPVPPFTTSSTIPDTKPYLSNPVPTPELIETVSKVVAEARARVGISAAKEIQPYFEDEYGEPDTLPVQLIDPETKYCRPHPHWKASLTRQVAWIPTYILRFRSTIPNDRSELSSMLKNLSNEHIIALLNDGPFKTAQTAWRDLKKTDEELEMMRVSSRRYSRTERKSTMRSQYIKMIPSLKGPEWEYLSHPGYMSQDESDDEDGLVTKRPDHRAQWETNLFEAICVAQLDKARAQPGLCSRPPRRTIEMVRRPIPHLERGTGSNKVTIRIALCGVSKSWREKYPSELQKYNHLINAKATTKPNIDDFLAKHPNDNDNNDDGDTRGWGFAAATQLDTGEERAQGMDRLTGGEWTGGGSYAVGHEVNSELDGGNTSAGEGQGEGAGGGGVLPSNSGERLVDLPIDPWLLPHFPNNNTNLGDSHVQQDPAAPRSVSPSIGGTLGVRQDTTARSVTPLAVVPCQTPLEPARLQAAPTPVYNHVPTPHSKMPPPPLLHHEHNPAPNGAATEVEDPQGATHQARKLGENKDTLAGTTEPSVTQPKRCGRPPGSKNKKK